MSPFISRGSNTDLEWLLHTLTEQGHGIRGAVLLAADGVVRASYGWEDTQIPDRLAAVTAGMYSLLTAAALSLGQPGERPESSGPEEGVPVVRQVVGEAGTCTLLVRAVGSGLRLLVVADPGADVAEVQAAAGGAAEGVPR